MKNYSFGSLVAEGLKHELRNAVMLQLKEDLVAEFEREIEPLVKKAAEKIAFKSVESTRDLMHLRDEIKIYVKWINERAKT